MAVNESPHNLAAKSLYERLQVKKGQIRLLNVRPSTDPDAEVRCSLSVHRLNQKIRPYKALSYVWLGEDLPREIIIEDMDGTENVKFTVEGNLASALRHIRLPSDELVIWIDAICIDQTNDGEKSGQVKRMGDVYGGSEETIVWLGNERDESTPALDFLMYWADRFVQANGGNADTLWTKWYMEESSHDSLLTALEKEIQRTEGKYSMSRPKNWDGVEKFGKRLWWFRLWVFQESVLPKALTFQCGTKKVDGTPMGIIAVLIELSSHIEINRGRATTKLHKVAEHIKGCFATNSKLFGMFEHRYRCAKLGKEKAFQDPLVTVQQLSYRQVTNHRDKLYGVVGLMKRDDIVIVDYRQALHITYMRFATDQAKYWTPYLRILSYAGIGNITSKRGPWPPSWVPDWRTYQEAHNPIGRDGRYPPNPLRAELYRAGKDRMPPKTDVYAMRRITVKAVLFDTVSKPDIDSHRFNNVDAQHYGISLLKIPPQDTDSQYPTGCCYLHALVRTIMADCPDGTARRRISSDGDNDRNLLLECMAGMSNQLEQTENAVKDKAMESSFPWSTEIHTNARNQITQWPSEWNFEKAVRKGSRHLEHACRTYTAYRCLYTTAKGYFGLGPARLHKGDLVCVIPGCNVPHLLRKHPNGKDYQLVGETYVHGIMDGEVIDMMDGGEFAAKKLIIE